MGSLFVVLLLSGRCADKNKQVFGKCNNLHGHNYKVEFSFSGFIDQETWMVVNLTDLKVILQVNIPKISCEI
jgi:6-pyruvoyl-tetrahydropterin synthase